MTCGHAHSKRWSKHDMISSWTSVFHTFSGSCLRKGSTPQGHLSLAPPHQHLQWWGAATDRYSWGCEWIGGPHPHRLQPSVTSASPSISWVMWWWTSRCLSGHPPRGHWTCSLWHWADSLYGLSFHWVLRPRVRKSSSGTSITTGCFNAMSYWNSPEKVATLELLLQNKANYADFWWEQQLI